jgi:hypothetical protein
MDGMLLTVQIGTKMAASRFVAGASFGFSGGSVCLRL